MKFLEKVKNMFTEEIEEEEQPIRTEVRKVEISTPVKPKPPVKPVQEEKEEENISENETLNKEEKFKFPVYFDDKDFDALPTHGQEKKEPPKKEPVKPVLKEQPKKEAYGGKSPVHSIAPKEEKKVFKPTPIISPVYGILDKNYKKEDITPKKRVHEIRSSKELTVDDIRNKAFGLNEKQVSSSSISNEGNSMIDDFQLFDELDKVEEPKHGKNEATSRAEKNKELELLDEVDELDRMIVNERKEVEKVDTSGNMIEDEMDRICSGKPAKEEESELTESELFNLIDSMYEKKDGEE